MAARTPSAADASPATEAAARAGGPGTGPTPPPERFRLLAPLLVWFAALLHPVRTAVAGMMEPAMNTALGLPGMERFRKGDEAQNGLIPGIVLFGVGLIIAIIITVVVLQFYPLLTSEVNTAQTDPNSTTSATNSLDLLPLVIVIGLVFLSLGTMFAGLSMIVKATRGIGQG